MRSRKIKKHRIMPFSFTCVMVLTVLCCKVTFCSGFGSSEEESASFERAPPPPRRTTAKPTTSTTSAPSVVGINTTVRSTNRKISVTRYKSKGPTLSPSEEKFVAENDLPADLPPNILKAFKSSSSLQASDAMREMPSNQEEERIRNGRRQRPRGYPSQHGSQNQYQVQSNSMFSQPSWVMPKPHARHGRDHGYYAPKHHKPSLSHRGRGRKYRKYDSYSDSDDSDSYSASSSSSEERLRRKYRKNRGRRHHGSKGKYRYNKYRG